MVVTPEKCTFRTCWPKVDGTTDVLIKSPDFFELGTKLTYDVPLNYGLNSQLNRWNTEYFQFYQTDFDKGSTRDSGYIYGPGSPFLLCRSEAELLV